LQEKIRKGKNLTFKKKEKRRKEKKEKRHLTKPKSNTIIKTKSESKTKTKTNKKFAILPCKIQFSGILFLSTNDHLGSEVYSQLVEATLLTSCP
jgi:hypothetical protein